MPKPRGAGNIFFRQQDMLDFQYCEWCFLRHHLGLLVSLNVCMPKCSFQMRLKFHSDYMGFSCHLATVGFLVWFEVVWNSQPGINFSLV